MRLTYAGDPGTAQAAGWERFLKEFGDVSVVDVELLMATDLGDTDVLIVDGECRIPGGQPGELRRPRADLRLEHFPVPTVLCGEYGANVSDVLNLKLGTVPGCLCLAEDAIPFDMTHEVFAGLTDAIVERPNPMSKGLRGTDPTVVPMLRVLREPYGRPGQVTAAWGFLDSPECELVSGGVNDKGYSFFAIARQSRFLQGGFAGSPEDYTDAGRSLLRNCLGWIPNFAGDPVRELRTMPTRELFERGVGFDAYHQIALPAEVKTALVRRYISRHLTGELPDALLEGDRDTRLAWYDEHAGFLGYADGRWYVDSDLQVVGLANTDLALLEHCVRVADDRAARLWQRYTGRRFDADATAWLAAHRDALYFTDRGGYRWVAADETPTPITPDAQPIVSVSATLGAARYPEGVRATLLLDVPAPFHAYGPGSDGGLPVTLSVNGRTIELAFRDAYSGHLVEGHLVGQLVADFAAPADADTLTAVVRVQLCDDASCLPPQSLELSCAVASTGG